MRAGRGKEDEGERDMTEHSRKEHVMGMTRDGKSSLI